MPPNPFSVDGGRLTSKNPGGLPALGMRSCPAARSVTGEIRFRARNREGRTSATETFLP